MLKGIVGLGGKFPHERHEVASQVSRTFFSNGRRAGDTKRLQSSFGRHPDPLSIGFGGTTKLVVTTTPGTLLI